MKKQNKESLNFIFKIVVLFHRLNRGIANRVLSKDLISGRSFSNKMLGAYSAIFKGSVINVSGWDDRDGFGSVYRSYFKECKNYTISNAPVKHKGVGSLKNDAINEIEIDLNYPIISELSKKYDIVFNHTTLEHVFNTQIAFKNLCDMSREVVIIVAPVIQQLHNAEECGDYNRLTTMGIAKNFKINGFDPVVIKTNDQPFAPVYCFAIAVKSGSVYKSKIKEDLDFEMGKYLFGSSLKKRYIDNNLK